MYIFIIYIYNIYIYIIYIIYIYIIYIYNIYILYIYYIYIYIYSQVPRHNRTTGSRVANAMVNFVGENLSFVTFIWFW